MIIIMDKKNRSKSIKVQASFIIFALGVLAALPLRMYQMMNIIEPETGFYSTIDPSVPLLYAVLGGASILFLLLTFMCGKIVQSQGIQGKKISLSIVSLLFSAALIWDAVLRVGDLSNAYFEYTDLTDITVQKYIVENGLIPISLQTLFAVLAGVYFLVFAFTPIIKKVNYEGHKLLALSPLLWTMFRIIFRFMRKISFTMVSELLFELIMLSSMMLFFMTFARVSSRINDSLSVGRIYGFGLLAALFALVCSVPRIALLAMGRSDMLVAQSPVEWVDFAVALFIIVYLFSSLDLIKLPAESDNVGDYSL